MKIELVFPTDAELTAEVVESTQDDYSSAQSSILDVGCFADIEGD